MSVMLQLLVGGALAGSPDVVATGQDLIAWRALQEQTDPAAWRGFLLAYPDSPLAERAWRRLVEVGHAPDASSNPTLGRIAASYAQHEADLARTPEGFAVATLRLDDAAVAPPPERSVRRSAVGLRMPLVLTSSVTARSTGWRVVAEPSLEVGVGAAILTDESGER